MEDGDDEDGGGGSGEGEGECKGFREEIERSSSASWTVGGGDGICIATSEPDC